MSKLLRKSCTDPYLFVVALVLKIKKIYLSLFDILFYGKCFHCTINI